MINTFYFLAHAGEDHSEEIATPASDVNAVRFFAVITFAVLVCMMVGAVIAHFLDEEALSD